MYLSASQLWLSLLLRCLILLTPLRSSDHVRSCSERHLLCESYIGKRLWHFTYIMSLEILLPFHSLIQEACCCLGYGDLNNDDIVGKVIIAWFRLDRKHMMLVLAIVYCFFQVKRGLLPGDLGRHHFFENTCCKRAAHMIVKCIAIDISQIALITKGPRTIPPASSTPRLNPHPRSSLRHFKACHAIKTPHPNSHIPHHHFAHHRNLARNWRST